MPIDYSKAKIYCIRSPNTDLIYIGATCQKLSQRMTEHRSRQTHKRTSTSKVILEYGNAYIELLENYPCNNKEELAKKEGEYIRTQNCCNKFIPDRTPKEYRNDTKEREKKRYEDNKETRLESCRQYREDNKQTLLEQKKQYYEANKQKILEYQKQYRERKKQEANVN